jgi:hypothetical protein
MQYRDVGTARAVRLRHSQMPTTIVSAAGLACSKYKIVDMSTILHYIKIAIDVAESKRQNKAGASQ